MEYYEYIKSIHLIAIFIWISMLVYLPKLLSYHYEALKSNNDSLIVKLKAEEKTIYRYVASIAFVIAVVSGISLIMANKSLLSSGIWIYLKFFLISVLAIIHHLCRIYMIELQNKVKTINKKIFDWLSYSTLFLISLITFFTLVKGI